LALQKTVIGLSVGITGSWGTFGSRFFRARVLLGHKWHVEVVWLLETVRLQDNHGQKWQYSHGQLDTIGMVDLSIST